MNAQVYRTETTLKQALSDVQELQRRYRNVAIHDKGERYNTELLGPSNWASCSTWQRCWWWGAGAQGVRGGHARGTTRLATM